MFNQIEHIKGTGATNVRLLGRGQMSYFQVTYTVTESLTLPGVDTDYSLESVQNAVICHGELSPGLPGILYEVAGMATL